MNAENNYLDLSYFFETNNLLEQLNLKTVDNFFKFDWISLDAHKIGQVVNEKTQYKIINNSIIIGNAYVGDFSLIRNSIICDNSHVGFGCELNKSILLPGTYIPHHNYVGSSILGNNVKFGGNVRIANTRLNGENVTTKFPKNLIHDFEVSKAGAIIGDNTAISSTVVICPGTLIGKNCIVEPMQVVKNFIPSNSYLKTKR